MKNELKQLNKQRKHRIDMVMESSLRSLLFGKFINDDEMELLFKQLKINPTGSNTLDRLKDKIKS